MSVLDVDNRFLSDKEGRTAFLLAASTGQVDVVEKMAELGAHLATTDKVCSATPFKSIKCALRFTAFFVCYLTISRFSSRWDRRLTYWQLEEDISKWR